MRKLLKPIAIVLVIAILLLTPFSSQTVMGASGISSEDSALLNKWSQLGLLDKGVSTSELYKPIQKIDFIRFVNYVLKPSKQADIGFTDVPKDSWYGKEIAKAVAAGYVANNEKSSFYPFSNITRVEASTMVAKVFGLELSDQKLLKKITDAEKLDADQLQAFGAVVEKGYLTEISSGRYAPLGVLKLIDAMKMLDKCMGLVITKTGTVTKNVKGNMIINTYPVTLKNMEISGDLIIGEGAADGNVSLEDVTVKGRLIIRGGGPNSVIIKSSAIAGDVIVEKYAGNVRVVAQGTTTIENTYLRSGGQLLETNLSTGKGFVNVFAERAVAANQIANLEGAFDNIQIEKSNINVRLAGKADKVKILEDTISSFTLVSGSAETITTKAIKSTIELLSGIVTNLNVEKNATGNRIDLNGVAKVSKINIAETTVVNFIKGNVETLTLEPTAGDTYLDLKSNAYIKTIIANAASTITGTGHIGNMYVYADNVKVEITPDSVYIANGVVSDVNGTIIDSTKPTVAFSVPDQVSLQVGATQKIAPSGTSPTGAKLSYISSNNNVATISDSGVITAVSIGTTKVYVTGQYSNYNTKTATIDVTVTSDNVTAPGTLEIDPPSGEAGTKVDFTLTYTAGDNMSNGTVVIKLPNGFSAFVSDTVSIDGGEEINLLASQIPNLQTLSFTNLNLTKGDTIIVYLRGRVVPTGGHYVFTTVSDSDSTGPRAAISGQENAEFVSDSLRILVQDTNYSVPVYGSIGGTTKIANLSFVGFTGATKWLIKVQDNAFTEPSFEDILPAAEYIEYTVGQDISAIAGQHLMLAAVDASNMVKAYKDITITSSMITPYSAGILVPVTNYSSPVNGIMANAVRINTLNLTDIAGATKWMYRVQDTATSNVYVDSKFEDAKEYTAGDDIRINANQHILLAAVDSNGNVKAYTDIKVTSNMVSQSAGSLEQDSNYSLPEYGDTVNTIKINTLSKADSADFADIDKWMYVTLANQPVIPARGASSSEFERYTEGKTFTQYTAGGNIAVSAGTHLLLVGVQSTNASDSVKDKILAYVDLTIDATQIRQADVIEIPDINFAAPAIGSKAGTTMFPDLNFNTSATGTTIPKDAVKYMIKVQDTALSAVPQSNSVLSGAINCVKNQDIAITAGQHLILLATDANGKIKAYKDIVVSDSQIRPADALKLLTPNDYSLPAAGNDVGTTKIVLSANGIPGFTKWIYIIGDTAFATPYKGSTLASDPNITVTDYASGADIKVSVGRHILIVAVDGAGKTLAYTDETISATQIKQPQASILKSSSEVGVNENYNYSEPEPGQTGGTTRITTLNTLGVQGATKWLYKVVDSSAVVAVPDYNSVISGLLPYIIGDSINILEGQRLILYSADSANRIKAYKDIAITSAQIRTPSAASLVSNTNYSTPIPGSTAGTTTIASLSFAGLTGSDSSWGWRYVVGDKMFSAPAKDSSANNIAGIGELTTTTATAIQVKAGQYILLLAVDGSENIKAYASIYVYASAIKPYNADAIPVDSFNLTKGTKEGTTCFDKLDLIGIVDAKNWMIKVQEGKFDTPAKDAPLTGSTLYSLKSNIDIKTGWHILLLATDTLNRVKAYADITVTKDQIQSPYATLLTENTNYTIPEPGSAAGTTTLMLSDTGIQKAAGESIVWKYKTSTQTLSIPLFEQDASLATEWTTYTSGGDISVSAGNSLLIVATINNKIVAYKLFTMSATQIKPIDAPLLNGSNYTGPIAGSKPGTTKINDLKLIGVAGATKWQIKVVDVAQVTTQTLDSVFTTPINYTSGDDIAVKDKQYVVLAAVDANGKVKAYINIPIDSAKINPPLANKLVSGLNYTTPKYGTDTGSTSIYVSPEGINGCDYFVVKVVDAASDIVADQIITTGAGDYQSYTSGSNIAVSAGQYVSLIAVDDTGTDIKVLAYENIKISEANIRPGNAVLLQNPQNYSALQPGSGVGTTKFSELTFVGIAGATKWIVKVTDNNIGIPMINSSVEGATGYDFNKDILVKEGQYVTLYAVDETGRIKGYVCLQVFANNVRGVAPLLALGENYSLPEPGSQLNKTKITTLSLPAGATDWKYSVQDSSPEIVVKDQLLSGLTTYAQGVDIPALEGQHLILYATDSNGHIKAYADILLTASNIRNVEIKLAGTAVAIPTGEGNIVNGGRTIIVKLAYGVWQDDVLSNATKRNSLFDGFVAAGSEQAQWGKVLAILKNEGTAAAIMNAADTITITLSETAAYNITDTQVISLTVKPETGLIKNATKAATSTNTVKIAADVIAQLSGTAVPSIGEGDIVVGQKQIIITLTNGKFALDVASDADKRNAIFDGIITSSSDTTMWGKVITALKAAGETAITRNSSNKITITLPAVSDYNISMNETISVTVPYKTATSSEILVDAIKDVALSTKIIVASNSTAVLSGTMISTTVSETDILTGGKTLKITLSDGQWVTDIKTNETKRNALFTGLVATADATSWAKVVTALKAAGQNAIERTDNYTVTITLPSVTGYNIAANQYITMTIPAACMIGGIANLTLSDTISIGVVATATLSGTAITSAFDESAVRGGGKTLAITLSGATWANDINTNTTVKNALFDGFKADVEASEWAKVVANLKGSSITKTSANVITITMPAVPDYNITALKQVVSITITSAAAIGTSFDIQSTNTMNINYTAPTAAKVVEVRGESKTYKLGAVIQVKVIYDNAVDVSGTPTLTLETGAVDGIASYKSGSGTKELLFEYTVKTGDTNKDLDYVATNSLSALGASIINSGTNVNAITTLPKPGATIVGSLSYTSNMLVDAVAPKLATGYPKAGTKTEQTANVIVKLDKASSVYYVTVLDDISNSVPTAEQVMGGLNAAGTAVATGMLGTVSVVENIEGTLAISNLSAYTDYTVYMVAVDSVGNIGTVSAFDFKTADTTAPQFVADYPKQDITTFDSLINILIKANEDGNAYMIALPTGSNAPTSTQVKAFKNASDVAVATNLRATAAITKDTEVTLPVTGLMVSSHYDIYVVCVDTSGNIIGTPAMVTAETSKLNMDKVEVDLAKSSILNTTTQMEYSFDSIIWKPCTATKTSITYDADAQILVVYMREAANATNMRTPIILTRADDSVIDTSLIDYDIAAGKIINDSTIKMQYRINGGGWKALNASSTVVNVVFEQGDLDVRIAATSPTDSTDSELPSAAKRVVNIPVPMPAPGLIYDDTTNKISGLLTTHEYSINGGSWVNGLVEGDFAGTKKVLIREKATKLKLASTAQTIQFTACALNVVASPAAADETINKNFVTIAFEENTNKPILSLDYFKNNFQVGTWDASGNRLTTSDWGTDIESVSWNTAGNAITITYNTMTGSTVNIGDEVRLLPAAGIQNAAKDSGDYTSTGKLTGSFHTVPVIESIKAVNTNNDIGFSAGERLVITFDQATNSLKDKVALALNASNIDKYLKLTDSTGKTTKLWGTNIVVRWMDYTDPVNNDADPTNDVESNRILTITFNDLTLNWLEVGDKITVDPAWGLTDEDKTTAVCNSSAIIGGSFTSVPKVTSVTMANGGVLSKIDAGDTIKITFDQATNAPAILASNLIKNFTLLASDGKTAHSWGVQPAENITWSADKKTLTIKLTSMTGVTVKVGDKLSILAAAGIKSADGGAASCEASGITIGGSY